MLSDFEICLVHVLKREGGFVNNPADRGGPTNFGITKKTFSNYSGGLGASDKDIFELTVEDASKIYKALFWDKMNLDALRSQKLKLMLFDQGVNRGPDAAIRTFQEVLKIYWYEDLPIDGIIGGQTEAAALMADESKLIRRYLQGCIRAYTRFALKNPSQQIFLMGWLARCFALWDAVS